MLRSRLVPLVLAGAFAVTATVDAQPALTAAAARSGGEAKPTIVSVHGAFADASGWVGVIRILQAKGYEVSAVQNPLSSYAADIGNVINPDLERSFAQRLGATTTEIKSSHVVFMSHPEEVAAVIEPAARAATMAIARTEP